MSALLEEALKKYLTIQCHAEREPYLAPKLGFTSLSSDRHIERRLRGMFVKYQCRCENEFYESRLLNLQEMMSLITCQRCPPPICCGNPCSRRCSC